MKNQISDLQSQIEILKYQISELERQNSELVNKEKDLQDLLAKARQEAKDKLDASDNEYRVKVISFIFSTQSVYLIITN